MSIRTLRTYTHTAEKPHRCDYCPDSINPGDVYEGEVVVSTITGKSGFRIIKKREFSVWKKHDSPPCERPHGTYEEDEDLGINEEREKGEDLAEIAA